MRLYGAISKIEPQADGTVRVEGIASSEAEDEQGETVSAAAMRAAIPDYMLFPALREMHQLSAAGTTLEATVDDDGMTRIVAHVVDPVAVSKVKTKTYRGFSIGGRVTKRDGDDKKNITGIVLNEISLVDRPANPEAIFDCWKASQSGEKPMPDSAIATLGDTDAGQKLAALTQPIQIWSCGVADHQHAAKADAVKCQEKQAAVEPMSQGEGDQLAKTEGDPAVETATEPAERAGEAEASDGADDAAEIEKRAQEGADEAQATIDAALAAMQRGEAVLADPENVEEAAAEWGIKTTLINEAALIYQISITGPGVEGVSEVRVGDVPWRKVAAKPQQGEWCLHDKATFQLGATPLGADVRCDVALKAADGATKPALTRDPARAAKSLYDVSELVEIVLRLESLTSWFSYESAVEGDSSSLPAKAGAVCAQLCALLRDLVAEETAEIMAGTEIDEVDIMVMAAVIKELRKAGKEELAALIEKAGAKHSARNQMMLDMAYECTTKCMKELSGSLSDAAKSMEAAGAKPWTADAEKAGTTMAIAGLAKGGSTQALMDMAHDCLKTMTSGAVCQFGKAGAQQSKETMVQLHKAHDFLCAAGANCDEAQDDDMEMAAGSADDLGKADAARARDLAKALDAERAEKAALTKTLGEIVPILDRLIKRVDDIANTPLPPATVARVGITSVSKAADGGGEPTQELTSEEIALAFARMSKDEQTKTLIKASYANPIHIRGLKSAPEIRERPGQ